MHLSALEQIIDLLKKEREIVVATVLKRSGSTPAPMHAFLAAGASSTIGTIGGGMLEATATTTARRVLETGNARIVSFFLDHETAAEQGMLCGGAVSLLLEPVHVDQSTCWTLAEESASGEKDGLFVVEIQGRDDPVTAIRSWVSRNETQTLGALREDAKRCIENGTRRVISSVETTYLLDPLVIPDTLLVFGGGHVAQALVPVAASIGFRCWVVDDRESFACEDRFPEAYRTVVELPAAAVGSLPHGKGVWAVVMTRGHKHDEQVLKELLSRSYRYIGMIGSERKKRIALENLEASGIPADLLQTVHCPIGLPIGGSSPAEIAISIAAELVAVRYDRRPAEPPP